MHKYNDWVDFFCKIKLIMARVRVSVSQRHPPPKELQRAYTLEMNLAEKEHYRLPEFGIW